MTEEVLEAVRQGRPHEVPELLGVLEAAEREALPARLKAIRAEARGWGWEQGERRRRMRHALLVAGAGCHTGAAATASWIGARDLRDRQAPPHQLVLSVLRGRDPRWLGDVAHRLAGRAATAREDYPLIHGLVQRSGCPVPVADGYVHGWVDSVARKRVLGDLTADPQAPVLVPRLFRTAALSDWLVWQDGWVAALAGLPEAGVVTRAVLVDGCVARLLRGGSPSEVRFLLELLRALELTEEEEGAHTADWAGIAAHAPSASAAHAQAVLGRLAMAGGLSARQLAEVSSSVLFRAEKKLVRAQLVLVGKALRRDAGAAGELLPVVAEVFGHADTALQERALKLVGRHLDGVGPQVRAALADSAAVLLSPAHRAAAVEVFGALPEPEGPGAAYVELLPPPPEPRPLAPAAEGPELVEEVAALLHSFDPDAMDTERALDGLVRAAHDDPDALREALLPLLPGLWWYDGGLLEARHLRGAQLFAAALAGRVGLDELRRPPAAPGRGYCFHERLAHVPLARAREAAFRALTDPLPFLLATPTWRTGGLEPSVLVERLAAYRRLGVRPGTHDVAQALLRVRRTGPGVREAAQAAAALGTAEGGRLAAWLAEGAGFGAVVRTRAEPPRPGAPDAGAGAPDAGAGAPGRLIEVGTRENLVVRHQFPPAFRPLGRPWTWTGRDGACHCRPGGAGDGLAVLPQDRETLAAWLLPLVSRCADAGERDGALALPALAEGGGEAGPALRLALAYGLGARHAEDRLAAVDALLVLAARGELDAGGLGVDLAELVAVGAVKVNRLADALRTTAASGAYATVWAVLAGALPGLLGGEVPRGTGEILAVAADCAERCGAATRADGAAPVGLAELAARGGSTQLVAQARRLAGALR
ncbi:MULTISPECIES: DUF6493 family protein [Streptomyces]|uniref:Secreted protein n=2 Tax=Streptomyces fradiae TaxID=1906 RepID=A0A1Y2NY10_STRFR|nr:MULTISPECIES: DUF6493 family protein [Streptomyces]KAF0651711.1 hypothetical protein K701_01895 [Streptomyces fradiae ATCC 10745 = DSM 40063]OSY52423.1 hypothetical protein BG846_01915 [Streptomyces fradiae ATCC 10745 = DSM 40063]QEV11140.1 hypothetical protein CP974_02965 [Streptomyces fradiae ATCC 10745 = DSM 40063]